jgi:hypothetical protein
MKRKTYLFTYNGLDCQAGFQVIDPCTRRQIATQSSNYVHVYTLYVVVLV